MLAIVADDDAITREYIAAVLEEDGFEVRHAADGGEALALIDRTGARLLLADWEMPGLSGLDLCVRLRERDGSAYVYTILVTGRGERGDIIAGLASGADDYITKPIDPHELRLRVRAGARVLGIEGRNLAIFALAKLAESRDPDTGAHLERTQTYCRVLAVAMRERRTFPEIDHPFVELIEQTSPLHDIGKIGIPDAVLLKRGRLTETEFAVMKQHTLIGARTLGAALERFPSAGYLRMARDIAVAHHEKWDGSGYPNGLAGDAIPLPARIMAVADVYDALRSARVYKASMSHAETMGVITRGSGSHFDPRIIDVLADVAGEFDATHRQLADAADPVNRLDTFAA